LLAGSAIRGLGTKHLVRTAQRSIESVRHIQIDVKSFCLTITELLSDKN